MKEDYKSVNEEFEEFATDVMKQELEQFLCKDVHFIYFLN